MTTDTTYDHTAACPEWHYTLVATDADMRRDPERRACSLSNTHSVQREASRYRRARPDGVVIVGSRHRLGKSPIAGWGSAGVGYTMACSCGGWVLRVNANKRESSTYARDHLRDAHGLRGQAATDALRF